MAYNQRKKPFGSLAARTLGDVYADTAKGARNGLNVSLKQIPGSSAKSASNKYGEHYSACEICSRNQNPAGVVYVTEQGNRYHNLESCSGLKRSVRLVKASSVSEMGACSRCG